MAGNGWEQEMGRGGQLENDPGQTQTWDPMGRLRSGHGVLAQCDIATPVSLSPLGLWSESACFRPGFEAGDECLCSIPLCVGNAYGPHERW